MRLDTIQLVLVEDQPVLLKTLVKAIGAFPEFEIVGTAAHGEEALAIIEARAPHAVLLDLELPGLDGIEITRRLKSAGAPSEIIILTSFDDEQKVYDAMCAGASGYLVKRVGPDKIRSAVHEVMAGGTVVEAAIARRFWNYFQSVQSKMKVDNAWELTPTELDVLRFVAKGLSNVEVGRVMNLERRTVRTHLTHVYRKMGVNSHVEAVVAALKAGLVEM
jgi:DNA-binding NarL/FixJ family response regulator